MPELPDITIAEFLRGAQNLFGLFVSGLSLRTIWAIIARRYGAWHPKYDYWWPRFPWRPLWRLWAKFRDWREATFKMGGGSSAGWTSVLSRLCLQYKDGDFLIGRARSWWFGTLNPMGIKAVRHLCLLATTGANKTTFLITMLAILRKDQPAVVIDVKGQITRVLARIQRLLGRNVHVLDPLEVLQDLFAGWNPLAEIAVLNARLGKDVTTLFINKIAAAIVDKMEGEKPFWPDSARILLAGLIGHVLTTEPEDRRNMIRVFELLTNGYREHAKTEIEAFKLLWYSMLKNRALGDFIPKAANLMLGADQRTSDNILMTLRSRMDFLDHPQVRRVMERSTFNLTDIKGGSDWVMLVAPATEIRESLKPWFRLIVMSTLYIHEMIPGNVKTPTFLCADELPSLGTVEELSTAAPLARGYGIRLLVVSQDIELLRKSYPKSYNGFLGNADAVLWMATGHKETSEYLSERLGNKVRTEGKFLGLFGKGHRVEREVMSADQVERFLKPDSKRMIVTRLGDRPIKAMIMPYYTDLPVWLYDPDPEHKEAAGRAAMRAWLADNSSVFNSFKTRIKALQITVEEARAMFGLPGPFTASDLAERAVLLEQHFDAFWVRAARRKLEALL